MAEEKIRKAFNVSLQSKKYTKPINDLLREWESDGLNLSTEACESLLLVNRIKNSTVLSNVIKICDILDKISEVYNLDKNNVDSWLSEVIMVDNIKLSEVLMNINQNNIMQPQTNNNFKRFKPEDFDEEIVAPKKQPMITQIKDQDKDKEIIQEETPKQIEKIEQNDIQEVEAIKQNVEENKEEKKQEAKETIKAEPIKKNIDFIKNMDTSNLDFPIDFLLNS